VLHRRAGAPAAAVLALLLGCERPQTSEPQGPAAWVGAERCGSCHAAQLAAWHGSHHDLAMQEAGAASVLGDFDDAKLTQAGVTTRFFRRDGRPFVRTQGPDGRPGDFEVRWTFGVSPLQQYLVELAGGRVQALGVAWDTRPREAGGQRWLHLFPEDGLRAGDPLHWAGPQQSWNYMCAECHSTNVRKGYDALADRFATSFSEIDVACEACHGPGSRHVAWAEAGGGAREAEDLGLAVALDERRGVRWTLDSATGSPRRSSPRESAREVETCARCHARASRFSDDYVHGRSLLDTHRVALLEEPLYWSDGQIRAEVYEYGSFLQSRMFASGVTCSDCHEPHSLALREAGAGVCAQCHPPARYATPEHHLHRAGSPGGDCIACHMPAVTYMQVDPRHDHSFRIPRPDRTRSLGAPNACNACHADRSADWAAEALRARHPQPRPGFQAFAEAFDAHARGAPEAGPALAALVRDAGQPGIVRASAALRLARWPGVSEALAAALADRDPLVRWGAVGALAQAEPGQRLRWLPARLDDPVRSVRADAARALAGIPGAALTQAQQAALERGLAEWLAAQAFDADRPEAHTNLGGWHAERGDGEAALAEYARALAIDPDFTPALVNRADLWRALGREAEAEASLREAVARQPEDAALRHALGLSLVRRQQGEAALQELARAAELAPDEPRFAYVHGVALHDLGRGAEAVQALAAAARRHPHDRELLFVLAAYLAEAGEGARALPYARRLVELAPDDPQARALLAGLPGSD
jgi:Flp pilus assembly protein TadD